MPESMSIRMSGTEIGIRAVLAALRGMPDVERMIELDVDAPLQSDDSSSAGLQDDTPSYFHEIELHVPNSVAYDHVHGRVETLASGAGVVVEWLGEE
jgi:hypothetical protein